ALAMAATVSSMPGAVGSGSSATTFVPIPSSRSCSNAVEYQSAVASPQNRGTRIAVRMRRGAVAGVRGDARAVPPGLSAARGAIAATVAAMFSTRRRVVVLLRPSADRRESLVGIDDPMWQIPAGRQRRSVRYRLNLHRL